MNYAIIIAEFMKYFLNNFNKWLGVKNKKDHMKMYSRDEKGAVVKAEKEKMCRICYGAESVCDKLISPCLCRGSMMYSHEKCLLQWVSLKGSKYCELCLYKMEIHSQGMKPFWKVISSFIFYT